MGGKVLMWLLVRVLLGYRTVYLGGWGPLQPLFWRGPPRAGCPFSMFLMRIP